MQVLTALFQVYLDKIVADIHDPNSPPTRGRATRSIRLSVTSLGFVEAPKQTNKQNAIKQNSMLE